MRKKSHISLALYLLDNVDSELLMNHRKAFVLGSVLPDCRPSFVTVRHNIEETFELVTDFVEQLTVNYTDFKRLSTVYCRRLGEVTHYIADYFTYPHNDVYEGTFKEHCVYEGELKRALRAYIRSEQIQVNNSIAMSFKKPQDLCEYVKKMHMVYIAMPEKNIASDCMYIVTLCQIVVAGVLHLLEMYLSKNEGVVAVA